MTGLFINYEEHCRVMRNLGVEPSPEEEWKYEKKITELEELIEFRAKQMNIFLVVDKIFTQENLLALKEIGVDKNES